MQNQLFILFTVIGGAAIVPILARRLRIPSAALEIVYGVFLFNVILHAHPEWFDLMKEVGLIYLMFIVGMELDLRTFIRQRNFYWYIIIPLLAFAAVPLLFYRLGYPYYMGIAVSMVSAGIVIPVLRESELIGGDLGRDIIGAALTGELMSILILMGVDIHHRYGLTLRAGLEGGKVLILFGAAALFLRFMYIVAWWNPRKVEKIMESEDPVEEGIRMIIFIAFTGAVLAYSTGLEPILGSFMAGLVFSYVFKSKGRFEDKINAVGFGFFIPFFFIGVGAGLDLDLLRSPESLRLSAFLTVMVLASRLSPVLFCRLMKMEFLQSAGMALLLSAPLSMMVVAGTLGLKMGIISREMSDALVLTGVISSIVYPSLFRPIARKMTKAPA